jgi:hypothetical protein
MKTPATGAGVCGPTIEVGLALMRGAPGHALNVGAADANIGKLAVAKAVQFAQASVIALPFLDEADEGGKHGLSLSFSSGRRPVNRFTRKIVICWCLKRNYVAMQLGKKRIA